MRHGGVLSGYRYFFNPNAWSDALSPKSDEEGAIIR